MVRGFFNILCFFSPASFICGLIMSNLIWPFQEELNMAFFIPNEIDFFGISILLNKSVFISTVTLAFWGFFLLSNIYQYLVNGRTEFIPKKSDGKKITVDKRNAMYPKIPKKYLWKKPSDFTLGKFNNKYFSLPCNVDDITHTLIIGSPGSGKSSTILNSLIYNFNFSKKYTVFCIDVKPELSRKSVLENRDDIKIFNPSIKNGWGWDVWYGLSSVSSDDEIIERNDAIARTIISNPSSGGGNNEFFYASARNLLVAFLSYGFFMNMDFIESVLQIIHVPLQDLIATIMCDESFCNEHSKISGMLIAYDSKTSDAIQDIEMTMRQELKIFEIDSVKYQLSENKKKACPEDLINDISIFVSLPDHLLKQYSTIFRLVIQQTINYLSSIPDWKRSDDPDAKMIWMMIDEFGSIGCLNSISEALARIRSRKVSIWLAVQSTSQLDSVYGHNITRSIIDNTENTLVFSCKDKQTAEMISAWCGQYQETKQSTSKKGNSDFAQQSYTKSKEHRNIMDVSDVMALRKNNELLVFTEGERYLIKKCPYFKIPMLLNKSNEIKQLNEISQQ